MIELAKALVAFQAEAPHIELDSTNPHFKSKFASLAGAMRAVRPVLAKHGLAVVQQPTWVLGPGDTPVPGLATMLLHVSGERLEDTMLLSVEKPGPQAQGAALTYARRYAVLAILGLVGDEDDDAETAELADEAKHSTRPEPQSVDAKLRDRMEEYATANGLDIAGLSDVEAKRVCNDHARAAK